jgi:hypothetical protein
MFLENGGKVTAVLKSALQADFGYSKGGFCQQLSRLVQPAICEILKGTEAGFFLENANEMILAVVYLFGYFLQGHGRAVIVMNIFDGGPDVLAGALLQIAGWLGDALDHEGGDNLCQVLEELIPAGIIALRLLVEHVQAVADVPSLQDAVGFSGWMDVDEAMVNLSD